MSDHELDNSSSVSVTSEEVARQMKEVTDPLAHHLAHFSELMRELENDQANRHHEDTASFRAASSLSDSGKRSDTKSKSFSI